MNVIVRVPDDWQDIEAAIYEVFNKRPEEVYVRIGIFKGKEVTLISNFDTEVEGMNFETCVQQAVSKIRKELIKWNFMSYSIR